MWETAAKRAIDISLSLMALVLLSPVVVLIAIAIRLNSPGSVLFRQQRLARGGEAFTLYKFRTMIADAPDIRNNDGSTFNSATDARVTSIGRFLRRTSLDEVPQLFNVLTGKMSLVGPRPVLVDQAGFYNDGDWRRSAVKPGITGLAQINGRNSIPWSERTQIDLEYVANQSLLLDLRILWQTIPYVLTSQDICINRVSEDVR